MFPRRTTLIGQSVESLERSIAEEEKRVISAAKQAAIFAANQEAIAGLKRAGAETLVGNLQVKPSIKGETDSQVEQALASGDTYEIDTRKIAVGSATLKDTLQRLCSEYQIAVPVDKIDAVSCTFVVTALAGQHAKEDADCLDTTFAEFVPVYRSEDRLKHVLAVSYSLNGETGLRLDNILVQPRTAMTCLGRHSESPNKALRAIEIPALMAEEVGRDRPDLFVQLQKQACLVAFIEYDLQDRTPVYEGFTARGGAGGEEPVMRGARGGKGISAYSVIGSGSATQDHSRTVTESGTRRLSKISVYLVGAIVINTAQQVLTKPECEKIHSLMKARAKELGDLYLPLKIYTYDHLIADLERQLRLFGINSTADNDIFEHSLLRLASIDEDPSQCLFERSKRTPENCFVDLGISRDSAIRFVENLQTRFEGGLCQYTPEFNQPRRGQAIRFSLMLLSKYMPQILQSITEILSDSRNLEAYRRYCSHEKPLIHEVGSNFDQIGRRFGISISKTDCAERVFLKMFGCEEKPLISPWQVGKGYVGRMMDVRFFLGISENTAIQIINTMHRLFPDLEPSSASIVSTDTRISDVTYCEIQLSGTFLCSGPFLSLFEKTLEALAEEEPLYIDSLRFKAGVLKRDLSQYVDELSSLAQHYQGLQLAEALLLFSTIINAPSSKQSERKAASDKVRRAIAFLESTQALEENLQFKAWDKKKIKEIQKALGW